MNKSPRIKMDYPLRKIEQEELISAFGSLRHARKVLGHGLDDMGAACFYINNPERIPPDREVEEALSAWYSAPKKKTTGRPSIKSVSRITGFCWSKTKQLLAQGGVLS